MRLIRNIVISSFYLMFFPPLTYAYALELDLDPEKKTFFSAIAIFIGIFVVLTAIILYRAYIYREVTIVDDEDLPKISDASLGKIEKVIRPLGATPASVKALSKIVEEETQVLIQGVRQEYSDKYQAVVHEKNKEIESVKYEFTHVQRQLDTTQQMYKKVNQEKKITVSVVKSIAEGLVVVNQKGEVLLMNPSAEKILGAKIKRRLASPFLKTCAKSS